MTKDLTFDDDRIQNLRIAANICRLSFSVYQLELLIALQDAVHDKGGDLDLKTIAIIETKIKERERLRSQSALLDKISTQE